MSAFLKQKGGYRKLRAYIVAEIIYDLTFTFTQRHLSKSDRTVDQMVQAARSGKQNIAEGSKAATTSSETEIKLTNVALSSLEELLIDYEDYLRVRQLARWDASHPRFEAMKRYASGERIKEERLEIAKRLSDEELANLCITLINQTTYLLRKLMIAQQDQFLREGGIRERMYKARQLARSGLSDISDLPDA